jgi:hypothetical protein
LFGREDFEATAKSHPKIGQKLTSQQMMMSAYHNTYTVMTSAYHNTVHSTVHSNMLQLQLIALSSLVFFSPSSIAFTHLPQSNDWTKSTMNSAEYRVVEQLLDSKKAWTPALIPISVVDASKRESQSD